tara:strand:+ start:85 stop:393 length:309 start_codon:yes stop_codon:yes gene_type:complete
MPAVARGNSVDSVTTNHGCTGSTTTSGLSDDVIINGTGVHRQTDATVPHPYPPNPPCAPHAPVIATGSTSVFANGLGVARVGDNYTSSDEVATGSVDVFAGP